MKLRQLLRRVPHITHPRHLPVLVFACIGAAAWFGYDASTRDHAADPAHPIPAEPSPAAQTAFHRRAAERTARLMGKPSPEWKLCPGCKLAFHGPDTVPENPLTGHTPGDWQP